MRLIDADKLRTIRSIQSGDFNSIETIQKWIDNAPTVNAVPVVRCEECKWKELCQKTLEYKGADGYCSRGERRTENETD